MQINMKDLINKVICGDCLEVMKQIPDNSIDLVLTDPPYGIGAGKEKPHNGWKDYGIGDWDNELPPKEYFDEIFRISKNQIIWGGNYFTEYLPPRMGWIVWDKGQRDFSLADGELAWTSFQKALRICGVARAKALQDVKHHPTQKSLEVMEFCIKYTDRALGEEVKLILDPFVGSGTTLVSCQKFGRDFIGIEKEEKYCQIARDRLRQGVLI